jgi:hypothetical protein
MAKPHDTEPGRRYRSAIPLTGGWIGACGFFLLGVGMVIDGFHSGIGEVFVGVFIIAIACILGGLAATTLAELTPTGLVYRYNFRRRTIPWSSIESIRAGRAPGPGPWRTLVIDLKGRGSVQVGSITGTRGFVQRTIDEFETFRADQIR